MIVRRVEVETHVEFHPTDRRQVIAVWIKEQACEKRFRRLAGRRFAGAHDPVYVAQRVVAVLCLVCTQCVTDPRPRVDIIDVEQFEPVKARLVDFLEIFGGHLVACFDINFTGCLVDEVKG